MIISTSFQAKIVNYLLPLKGIEPPENNPNKCLSDPRS